VERALKENLALQEEKQEDSGEEIPLIDPKDNYPSKINYQVPYA
jgi:hypothetical protein